MRRQAVLLAFAAAFAACRPDHWLGAEASRLSPDQRAALAVYERAAVEWREALAAGVPESDDREYIAALIASAERFLAAEADALASERAERFLAAWTRDFLTRSAPRIPNPKTRARALRSAHRWAPGTSSHAAF